MRLNLSNANRIFPLFMIALLFLGMSCGDSQNVEPQEQDNADLSSLNLSNVEISPVFSADETDYAASVDNSVTQTAVTAVAADSDATVEIDPQSPVDLDVGVTAINITVTAADGTTQKVYTVTVTRAERAEPQSPAPTPPTTSTPSPDIDPGPSTNVNLSSNANLSSLTLWGFFFQEFDSSILDYQVGPDTRKQITVGPFPADINATVEIDPQSPVALDIGENIIRITVTAPDGTTRKVYTVTVTRVNINGDLRVTRTPQTGVCLRSIIMENGEPYAKTDSMKRMPL